MFQDYQFYSFHCFLFKSNFAMGNTKQTNRIVYMLDFGLARQYVNNEGNVRAVSLTAFAFILYF